MISRRVRVQEKKNTQKGLWFLLISLVLLGVLVVYGIQLLVRSTNFISGFKPQERSTNNDHTPPGPPQLDPRPDEFTQNQKITLNIKAEANSTVSINLNGQKVKDVPVDDTSKASVDLSLNQGLNQLSLTATDQAGNTGPASATYSVTFDNIPPSLDISKPQDGDTLYPPNQTVSVEGKTEPETQVSVNDHVVIENSDGSFTYKLKLNQGDNTINVVATDKAQNQTTKTLLVKYNP